MARLKIWAELDDQFTNYSYLSEATVANFQNNRKIWISSVDKALLSDVGKILFKQSNGLISVIRTMLRRKKKRLRGGILTLNAVVQTQMMLNAQVAQIQLLSRETQKTLQILFSRS